MASARSKSRQRANSTARIVYPQGLIASLPVVHGVTEASIPVMQLAKARRAPPNQAPLPWTRALWAGAALGIAISSLPFLSVTLAFEGSTSVGNSAT